jgi:hypothetical protein
MEKIVIWQCEWCHFIMGTTKPRTVTEQTRIVERMMSGENESMISPELLTMEHPCSPPVLVRFMLLDL